MTDSLPVTMAGVTALSHPTDAIAGADLDCHEDGGDNGDCGDASAVIQGLAA